MKGIENMRLKPYWIKPGVAEFRLISDVDKPINDTNGGVMSTQWTERYLPGVCLFSRGETDRGFIKCWFYYSEIREVFLNEKSREDYVFWINQEDVVEIAL